MSLGHLGAMCGCSTGQLCADCQASRPMAARWAAPTNYDPTLHRRYNVGLGEVAIGSTGWTLGDVASAALIVLAVIAIRKEWK